MTSQEVAVSLDDARRAYEQSGSVWGSAEWSAVVDAEMLLAQTRYQEARLHGQMLLDL